MQNNQTQLFKKREEHTVELRNKFREEVIKKHRNVFREEIPHKSTDKALDQYIQQQSSLIRLLQNYYTTKDFPRLVQCINQSDPFRQHQGIIGVRKILSSQKFPPIQMIIDANLVPKMIQFIKQDTYPRLQFQATWALTNVASGSTMQCQSIIDKGGIPLFVKLLTNKQIQIAEQAIWALGNISGDCAHYRDLILRAGGLQPLVHIVMTCSNEAIVKQGAWAISNLSRGTPLPSFETVRPAIQPLCKVLQMNCQNDNQLITDICWALSYLSDGRKQRIQWVIQTGVVPYIVNVLDNTLPSVVIPALRTLGNIVTGNQIQTNTVVQAGGIDKFFSLLSHPKKLIRRQSCWAFSNITAGTKSQVRLIIQNEKLVNQLFKMLQQDEMQVQKQIGYIFSNAFRIGDPQEIFRFINQKDVLKEFVKLLKIDDPKILSVVLEAIKNMLIVGQKNQLKNNSIQQQNPILLRLHHLGTVDHLQKLQYHRSQQIYLKVVQLFKRFFQFQDRDQLQ